MSLPDVSRLAELDPRTWRALGERLREFNLSRAHPWIDGSSYGHWERASRALRTYRLRTAADMASLAARCFRYADPILPAEADAMLGPRVQREELVRAGLLVERAGGVVSPFQLTTHGEIGMFGDFLSLGSDAVMSMGALTLDLLHAAWGGVHGGTLLDMGCGAGAFALVLGGGRERVVGCDINARAVTLARCNALLNGITNAEFRSGDLFAPVAGERFDTILCQPPFLSKPDDAKGAVLMWGGARGDELPLRVLGEVSHHLAPRGRVMMAVEWGVFDDEPVERRIRKALNDESLNLLVVEAPGREPAEACIGDASCESPELDEEYERKVVERFSHFERIGLQELKNSILVLEKRESGVGWTRTVRVDHFGRRPVRAANIDTLLRGNEVASRGPQAILSTTVRFPEGTAMVKRDGDFVALFPESAIYGDLELSSSSAAVLEAVTSAGTIGEGVRALAERSRMPLATVGPQIAEVAAEALRSGLVVASD